MADLGQVPEPMGETSLPEQDKTPRYPSLTLADDNVDKVTGGDLKVGDECVGEFRLRVNSISDDSSGGKRISFDVLSIDEFEPEGAAGDEGDDSATGDSAKPKTTPKALRYS
jgi:hypothetical protein